MTVKTLFLTALTMLTAGITMIACNKDENPTIVDTTTNFTATLNGANEKPTSTTSPATGTFAGTLNETTRVLSYTVTYTGFPTSSTPTLGHLHRVIPGDAAGVNGANPTPEIPFPSLTSPIISSYTLANQARVDSMKNGFYYANIHTAQFPSGAIRGNITRR